MVVFMNDVVASEYSSAHNAAVKNQQENAKKGKVVIVPAGATFSFINGNTQNGVGYDIKEWTLFD